MLPPELVETIDDMMKADLLDWHRFWFSWLLISTALVVIGLALEGGELWYEMRSIARINFRFFRYRTVILEHRVEWAKAIAFIGWMLIVVGVAGEMFTEVMISDADRNIEAFDAIALAEAHKESAFAMERSAGAYERAAQTEREASQENERAAKALKQAEQERADAAKSLQAAEAATKEAKGYTLQIAQANERAAAANEIAERERLARLQLEAKLADRVITPDQRRRITEAFASMKGQTVDVVMVGDSLEITKTANAILEAIHNAGVLRNVFHPMAGAYAEGVIIGIRADAPAETRQAGNRFIEILRETLDGGVGRDDFDKIAVSGTGTIGGDPGAMPTGQAPIRLLIAPK